ncbi:MAG: nitroreductase/quinone reductase family protein [Caldilineaceae bacterium]
MVENSRIRRMMWFVNKFIMTPLFRMGLGAFMGNPFTGYIMVLKTVGRKTGQVRHTPVNYAILKGAVYCMAGFGKTSDWYRNLKAHPAVELILPSGPVSGTAEEVSEPDEALHVLRQVLKNSGFASFAVGLNPYTMPDETLCEKLKGSPAVRIRLTGIGSGAGDAGGWLWILELIVILVVIRWLVFH